jgi:hypothetical protein
MWITQHIAARTFVWLAAMAIPLQGVPSVACGCTSSASCCNEVRQCQGCCGAGSSSACETASASCCSEQTTVPCRCTGAKICRCGETSSCHQQGGHRQGGSCCSGSIAANNCCSGDEAGAGCSCGDNCQCGQQNNAPTEPAAPPVENNSPERILVDSAEVASAEAAYLPSTTQRHADLCAGVDALSALDRCVNLCRFTI